MNNYSPIRRGMGFALGWMLMRAIIGIVAALTLGVWAVTGKFPVPLKWIARICIIAVVVAGTVLLLSEI